MSSWGDGGPSPHSIIGGGLDALPNRRRIDTADLFFADWKKNNSELVVLTRLIFAKP